MSLGRARADVVGSLLRPAYLREARQAVREGRMSDAELRVVEDRAVREAIALQEAAGLDVVTDGERVRAATSERKRAEERVMWLMREWEALSEALAVHE